MRKFLLIVSLAAFPSFGCGENLVGAFPDTGVHPDASEPMDFGPTDGPPAPVYPPGPYGNTTGATLIDMNFIGYRKDVPAVVDSAMDEYLDVSLQQVRETEGYDFLLMNIAAEWCAGCRIEANQLPPLFEEWSSRGGYVMSVITEDTASQTALRRHLDSWVANFPINFTMVHDPNQLVLGTFGYNTLPLNVIVRLEDMEILAVVYGEDPAVFDTFDNLLRP